VSASSADEVAFYCMSSELYFPGAVGLVNSLRLAGHREPIYLLDLGLTTEHRRLLEAEATILDGPADAPPYMLKTIAPRIRPARTMVLIDVDMVVTRPLTELIETAAAGRVVAVTENVDRHVPEWGERLGLGPTRRGPYVSSGLVLLGGDVGAEVLALWDDRLSAVDYERSWFARNEDGYPFLFLDQDVLNAILHSAVPEDALAAVAERLAPHQPYRGLRMRDERTLRCSYADGVEPYVLHQFLGKPWVDPMYHGIYSRSLSRLWLEPDVAVPMPEKEVPLRMRRGARALAVRKAVDLADLVRWHVRDVIPEWIASKRGDRAGTAP
jgi:hypothetical protein